VEAATLLKAPRILQFATHAETDAQLAQISGWDNPLLHSMLIMAGADSWQPDKAVFFRKGAKVIDEKQAKMLALNPGELKGSRLVVSDGFLTAYDVTGLNLEGTELVNLTACQTALGQVSSEGVAGLRQAFILAGARSLTMSMWEVPVNETIAQIAGFYDRWLDPKNGNRENDRYMAFRSAQLAALEAVREEHGSGHPFFWAGIVYLGDPGDLPRNNSHELATVKRFPRNAQACPSRENRQETMGRSCSFKKHVNFSKNSSRLEPSSSGFPDLAAGENRN